MKKSLFFLFSLILVLELNCSKPKEITENEIYDITNQIIKDDTLLFGDLKNKFSDIVFSKELLNEIGKEDLEFIISQNKMYEGKTIKEEQLKVYLPFFKKYRTLKLDSISENCISVPLIFPNRQKVIIRITTIGQESTHVYIKEDGKWYCKKIFNCIIE